MAVGVAVAGEEWVVPQVVGDLRSFAEQVSSLRVPSDSDILVVVAGHNGNDSSRWTVMLDGGLLGTVDADEFDFPWVRGVFEPGPAFAAVSALFERELALMETEEWEEWQKIQERLRDLGLRLLRPNGSHVTEVLLHVEGNTAWFRWADEPEFPSTDSGN